jgi:hypothetical protein
MAQRETYLDLHVGRRESNQDERAMKLGELH